jgi:hypothetical protein
MWNLILNLFDDIVSSTPDGRSNLYNREAVTRNVTAGKTAAAARRAQALSPGLSLHSVLRGFLGGAPGVAGRRVDSRD